MTLNPPLKPGTAILLFRIPALAVPTRQTVMLAYGREAPLAAKKSSMNERLVFARENAKSANVVIPDTLRNRSLWTEIT